MGCTCSDHTNAADHAQKVREVLGSVGLNEIIEQGREAISEAGRALVQLNRSERATSLGFGSEVSKTYYDAAERSNRRGREQLQTVISAIDARLAKKDWKATVERVRVAFKDRGGAQKLADLREDVRVRLLNEEPGISARHAELSLTVLDDATKVASSGDLNDVLGHMRKIMDWALHEFESAEMGRQLGQLPLSDQKGIRDEGWCIAMSACLAWAWSSLIACLIVCFALPFCWCCFHFAVLVTFMAHQLLCAVILGPLCNGP